MSPRPADRIIVAGLGRCGTSLAMQMLAAGGMDCLGRFPDFEVEQAQIGNLSASWLASQRGAVKLLDLHRLPIDAVAHHGNAILWLDRNIGEQAKSQAKFLRHMAGLPVNRQKARALRGSVRADTETCHRLLAKLPVPVLRLSFEELIDEPDRTAGTIASWARRFGFDLHVTRMAYTPAIRTTKCLPGFFEPALMEIGRRLRLRAEP